ncbi:unnamed protein product, partial [Phaeothamnion confervicola]
PLFLQDTTDGLCLGSGSGEVSFRRCAIDTLWYSKGSPNSLCFHHFPVAIDNEVDGQCLDRKAKSGGGPMRLGSCEHCSAAGWSVTHGSEADGYVLSVDDGAYCVRRKGDAAVLEPCGGDDAGAGAGAAAGAALVKAHYVTREDLEAMSEPGVRLITAASDGDKKAVRRWIDAGADVNARDWDNLTPLIAAASAGHLDIVKTLLGKGADVNAKDKDDITALMEASIMGHDDIVKLLVKEEAEVDAKTTSGVTALWLAAGEGRREIVSFLLSKNASV